MVRSRWIGAVAGMLSCVAPVVVAQAPVMQANRVVQVREAGQAPRACRVVHCWKEVDGSRICQVEALDNGDKLTIYEPVDGSSMRVFKGHAKAPAPVSPRATGWASQTRKQPVPVTPPIPTMPTMPPSNLEPPAAPTVARVETTTAKPSNWRESWGTIDPSTTTAPTRTAERTEDDLPPLGGKPATPVTGGTTMVPPPPATPLPVTPLPVPPPPSTVAPPMPEMTPPPTINSVVPPPSTVTPPPATNPVVPPPSTVTPPPGVNPVPATEPTTPVPSAPTTRPTPPLAQTQPADPLSNPEEFTRTNLPRSGTRVETPSTPALPGVGNPGMTPLPAPTTTPNMPVITTEPMERPVKERGILGFGFKPARPGTGSTTAAAQEEPPMHQPLMPPSARPAPGMASVMAATEEIRTGPKGKGSGMGNAMSLPNTPAGPGIGIPAGAGNAFTPAVTNRPIPSDMGGPGMVRPQLAGPLPPLPPQPLSPAMQQQMMAAAMAEQQAAMAQMAMMQQHQQMMMAQQAAEQRAMAEARVQANRPVVDTQTPKLLASLKDSLLPSEREMAAEGLRQSDWKANPQVVAGLTEAAKTDPSPMVRVACIKTLGAMKANAEPVIQTLELLSVDQDVRIRDEAKAARAALATKR